MLVLDTWPGADVAPDGDLYARSVAGGARRLACGCEVRGHAVFERTCAVAHQLLIQGTSAAHGALLVHTGSAARPEVQPGDAVDVARWRAVEFAEEIASRV